VASISVLGKFWRLRPLLAYGVMFLIMAGLLYSLVADARVSAYEASAERDPATGVIRGFEPIALNTDNTDRAVLLIHGFIGAPSNYGALPQRIADAGWRVEGMLLPGYGTTPREMERTTYDDYRNAIDARYAALRKECGTVVIMGHSLGGALATLAAADLKPDGLVLIAPFFGLTPYPAADRAMLWAARAAAPVLRWLPSTGNPPINQLENADHVDRYRWVPSAAGVTAMQVCRKVHETEAWKSINCPLLVVHSHGDKVTNPEIAETVFPGFASAEKDFFWIEKSNHVYFWDYDADAVNARVLEFLGRRGIE